MLNFPDSTPILSRKARDAEATCLGWCRGVCTGGCLGKCGDLDLELELNLQAQECFSSYDGNDEDETE